MNIEELDAFLRQEHIGSATISVDATGRVYASATVRSPNTPFTSTGRYGNTVAEALVELQLVADAAPAAAKPADKAPVAKAESNDDLLGDLL